MENFNGELNKFLGKAAGSAYAKGRLRQRLRRAEGEQEVDRGHGLIII